MARRKGEAAWADPSLLILGSLVSGPMHGYAMVADIEDSAGVSLGPGTLYAALARLEERGQIRALGAEDRRRPYEITEAGRELLTGRLEAMQAFATQRLARLKAAQA